MEWSRMHPYTLTITGAILVLAAGGYIVWNNVPVAPSNAGLTAWSGNGAAFSPGTYGADATGPNADRQSLMQQVQGGAPYTYTLPVLPAANPLDTPDSSFDFNAFIALLSNNSGTDGPAAPTESAGNAYAYIPTGLISSDAHTTTLTPSQQALYDYGNEAGSFIQSFESQHSDSPRILKDQAEDRSNAVKATALKTLGQDLAMVGDSLLAIENVPQEAAAVHKALAQSYVEIGGKLAAIAQTRSDADFIAAVGAYDASVNVFVKNYVALAQLFGAYGVTFAGEDPGSVFTFSPTSL